MQFRRALFFTSLLSLLPWVLAADLQQAFIDDQEGDSLTQAKPTYIGGWGQGSSCSNCNLKPDVAKAYKGTWHDTTHLTADPLSGVNFEFTGVSLEVFCILPPNDAKAILNYSLTFNLDGNEVGTPFIRTQENLTAEYQYNVSVVNFQNLTSTKHNFTMQLESKDLNSVALFDYAVYEFESTGTANLTTGTGASASGTSAGSGGDKSTPTNPPGQTGSGANTGNNNGAMTDFRFGFGERLIGTALMIFVLI